MDIELFGKRLKELRGKASQADCAAQILEKTGISLTAQTLGRYENGKRKPDIEIIEALAETFGVSADYLLCRTDVKTNDLTIKQICDYTGLSEEAVTTLHYTSISSDEDKTDILFTMSRLTPGLLALCGYLKSCGTQIMFNNNLITETLKNTNTKECINIKDYMKLQKAEENNDYLKWKLLKKCETLLLSYIDSQSNTNE